MILINEHGINTCPEDGGEKLFYPWNTITSLIVVENFFIFMAPDETSIYFKKEHLPMDDEEFIRNIEVYIPKERIIYNKLEKQNVFL